MSVGVVQTSDQVAQCCCRQTAEFCVTANELNPVEFTNLINEWKPDNVRLTNPCCQDALDYVLFSLRKSSSSADYFVNLCLLKKAILCAMNGKTITDDVRANRWNPDEEWVVIDLGSPPEAEREEDLDTPQATLEPNLVQSFIGWLGGSR